MSPPEALQRSAGPLCRDPTTSVHRLYGLSLASDFPFAAPLRPASGPPDLTFRCVNDPGTRAKREAANRGAMTHLFTGSAISREDGEPLFRVYRNAERDVLSYTGVADFDVRPDRITCHLLDARYAYAVEIYLLGLVLSYWLEGRGLLALHGSAVAIDGDAVAFLGANRSGKSGLAGTFLQAGCPLLTDDVLTVEDWGRHSKAHPGYPQMRMWPDLARHFVGAVDRLTRVHPALEKRRVPVGPEGLGTFCESALPISRIYLPERGSASGRIRIEPVGRGAAVPELIRASFLPNLARAVGLEASRFTRLSRLVARVPVRRLIYPEGLEHLSRVRDAILADVGRSR